MIQTGSKKIVVNTWSDAAREAAKQARAATTHSMRGVNTVEGHTQMAAAHKAAADAHHKAYLAAPSNSIRGQMHREAAYSHDWAASHHSTAAGGRGITEAKSKRAHAETGKAERASARAEKEPTKATIRGYQDRSGGTMVD